jgi:hypothetical protein
MLKFAIETSIHLPLHVSVHLDHLQGAYGDPVQSVTASHSAQHPIHTTAWNTCCPNNEKLLTMYFTDNSAKGNFSMDHHKLPEDGPNGLKHVGANV